MDVIAVPIAGAPPAAADRLQLRYARLLDWGTRGGLALLLLSFLSYLTGVLPPQVPLERLPELWVHPANHYLELTGAPTGWQWIALLHHGDLLGLSGIAVLAGCSGLCVLSLLPLYHADGDRAYLWIGLAQVAVLLLAASGLLQVGH